jgi:TPR repeat protein
MPQVSIAGYFVRLFFVISCLAAVFNRMRRTKRGYAAYNCGDYNAALAEFRKEDDASSQFALGVMYYKGQGVRKDPEKAL